MMSLINNEDKKFVLKETKCKELTFNDAKKLKKKQWPIMKCRLMRELWFCLLAQNRLDINVILCAPNAHQMKKSVIFLLILCASQLKNCSHKCKCSQTCWTYWAAL